jgi:hypothetical protein
MDSDTLRRTSALRKERAEPARLELRDYLLPAANRRLELIRPGLTLPGTDILDASMGFAEMAGSTQPSPPNRRSGAESFHPGERVTPGGPRP